MELQGELRGTKRPPAGSGRSGTSQEIQCCAHRDQNLSSPGAGNSLVDHTGSAREGHGKGVHPLHRKRRAEGDNRFFILWDRLGGLEFSRENAVLTLAIRRVHALWTGSPVTSGGTARRTWGVSPIVAARTPCPAWQVTRGDRTSGGNGPNCGAGSGAGGCVLRGERVHQIAEAAGCIRTAWAGSHMRATQLGVRRFRRLPMRRNPRDRSAGAGSRTWTVSKLWFACLS